jgi:chromosomal replication initiation ATPase DnaA
MRDYREGDAQQLPVHAPGGLTALLADNRIAAHLHLAEGYVSRAFCIKPCELYRTTRGRAHVAEARQLVMYLAHVEIGLRLAEIAHRYRRDRSTVAYACREIESRRDDGAFDEMVCQIEQLISMRDGSQLPVPAGDMQ